jgi:hypothetical protein
MCAKLLHHAGVAKVIVREGNNYSTEGIEYLKQHNVEVEQLSLSSD